MTSTSAVPGAAAQAGTTLVAIDGPGGAGKSTVAAELARRLGVARLDTGAMYRALTLAALRRGIGLDDAPALEGLARALRLEVGDRVLLDGEDVTEAIRGDDVNGAVSLVAAHPGVRVELVRRQREWVEARGSAVVEGRDIGSVVLPGADLKVYLTADAHERAARRAGERAGAPGPDAASVEAVRAAMELRDRLDSSRGADPLVVAEGAVVVDSTGRGVGEVVEELWGRLVALGKAPARPSARPEASAVEPPRDVDPAPAADPAPAGQEVRPASRAELAFYALCRAVAVGASRLWWPGPVLGAERLPRRGAYVLAPVHRSNVDWLVVARVTRRRLRYVVKEEVWRVRPAGRLAELLGAFPVHRGAADREALARAEAVLAAGEPLVVFPEGTRRSGPVVGDLRAGAAYLALRTGVPVVPVGVSGLERSMPRGARFPRPGRVRVVVGEPIDPGLAPRDARGRPRVARSAVNEMNERIRLGIQAAFDEAEMRG